MQIHQHSGQLEANFQIDSSGRFNKLFKKQRDGMPLSRPHAEDGLHGWGNAVPASKAEGALVTVARWS